MENAFETGNRPSRQCGESKFARILSFLPEVGRRVHIVYVGLTLVLLAFVNGRVSYYQQYGLAPYDLALLAIALLLGAITTAAIAKGRKRLGAILSSSRTFLALTVVGTTVLFIVQLIVIAGAWFETGWDVIMLSDVESRASQSEYFSTYPNQWFLAGFFVIAGKVANAVGVEPYLFFTVLGALGVALSVGMTAYIGRALGGPIAGAAAFALSWILLGLNPNILVPYSDAYGMLCPTIVLFAYATMKSTTAKWLVIPFFSYVGYCIKPTAIFAPAAIIAIEALFALANALGERKRTIVANDRKRPSCKDRKDRTNYAARAIAKPLICGAVSLVLSFCFASVAKSAAGFTPDEERAVSVSHYLMMGFNEEYNGVYSPEDFAFTSSFATPEERTAANIEAWKQRVAELGPVGIGELFAKKAMLSYGEGAFTWRDWYFENVYGDNEVIRWLYSIPSEDETPLKLGPDDVAPWVWPAQVLWFAALAGIVLTALNRRAGKKECVVCLALLMLSVFLLCFECRARYLFLFAPWFVALGVCGWRRAGFAALRRKK